jgi:hypothetical protein
VTTKAKIHIDNGVALSPDELAHCEELTSEQLSAEVDNLITSLFTEKTVRLKIGTLVMCTANIDVERGICNGSQGVVMGYAESVATVLPDELMRKIGVGTTTFVPVVQFANGTTIKVAPHPRQSEEYPCIIVSQIPLCLAWALTIHKIQGATLDMAEMDIGRSIFAAGQSYVALSRVKTLDGLYLSEFNSTKIRANPLVIEFYNSFSQMGEDEMRQIIPVKMREINALKEDKTKTEVKMKQSTLKSFAPVIVGEPVMVGAPVAQNPFAIFNNNNTKEFRSENKEEATKDPTIKTIKLSKY